MTRSNLTTTVPPGLQEDMLVSCHALNPRLGVTKQGSQRITVLRKWIFIFKTIAIKMYVRKAKFPFSAK